MGQNLILRMNTLAATELGWNSTPEETEEYFELIQPKIKGKVVLDIGCGDGAIFAPAARQVFRHYYGLDVLRYGNWGAIQRSGFMEFYVAHPSEFVNKFQYPPEVILLKDVIQWLPYGEIRRLLFNLPSGVPLFITGDAMVETAFTDFKISGQVPYNSSLSLYQSVLNLPIQTSFNLVASQSDGHSRTKLSIVVPDLEIWKTRESSRLNQRPEPCPDCGKTLPKPILIRDDVSKEGAALYCSDCAFSVPIENFLSFTSNRSDVVFTWNKHIQESYRKPLA